MLQKTTEKAAAESQKWEAEQAQQVEFPAMKADFDREFVKLKKKHER
jgi:hypothetical protein